MHLGKRAKLLGNRTAAIVFCLVACQSQAQKPSPLSLAETKGLNPILTYISTSWDTLTRSMSDCNTVVDPKLVQTSVLYLPAGFPQPDSVRDLPQRCHVQVRELPMAITDAGQVSTNITPPGLLYLANRYVVPGGRFNEMYGWDSYFIIRGLIEDKRIDLARDMVENFFFEVDHYGALLNANRTYYLTRSQPPFLSSMAMAVYQAKEKGGSSNRRWLQSAYDHVSRD